MRFVFFVHSLVSCWNHGNAHFLRGVLSELWRRGHSVHAFEPANGWSRTNLIAAHGPAPVAEFAREFPELSSTSYTKDIDIQQALDGADVVVVHEWTDPAIVAAIGRARLSRPFTLFFHDTHHRAVSAPEEMRAFDLSAFDGVLAFGNALAEIYRRWGWRDRVFTWHEAADTKKFRPAAIDRPRNGVVWIGNWGDDERSRELEVFLLRPAAIAGAPLDIYGVRYPQTALSALARHGATYRGWVANARVASVFHQHLATVHVPRRYYAKVLPGIPTIRVFEALACGIPLVCAPWDDVESLFRPGEDFLVGRSEAELTRHLRALLHDGALRATLVANGLERIRARHSCSHRVDELLEIVRWLRQSDKARVA